LNLSGVLIIDDYGRWQGCRMAVDEYFAESGVYMLLTRVDSYARIGVKP
ncbi:MAG: macrocin O-methyltransferase, partial [Proteobacteria bacterium]|nr:macrocin O-methyltransferase [Pseudomonadota bacterium]